VLATMALPTPVRSPTLLDTPLGLHGGDMPWAVQTPSPSFLAKQLSDPFQLRRGAEANLGPLRHSTSGALAAARTTMMMHGKQVSRQLIRQICVPFFEEMLDAVEHTMAQALEPKVVSTVEEDTNPDMEDYPFMEEQALDDHQPANGSQHPGEVAPEGQGLASFTSDGSTPQQNASGNEASTSNRKAKRGNKARGSRGGRAMR